MVRKLLCHTCSTSHSGARSISSSPILSKILIN